MGTPGGGTSRTIVVMPPRRWNPSQTFLDQLVGVGGAAWTSPVSLRQLAASNPPEVDRARLTYPKAQRDAELPDPYLAAADTFRSSTALLSAILTDRDQLVPELTASHRRM